MSNKGMISLFAVRVESIVLLKEVPFAHNPCIELTERSVIWAVAKLENIASVSQTTRGKIDS